MVKSVLWLGLVAILSGSLANAQSYNYRFDNLEFTALTDDSTQITLFPAFNFQYFAEPRIGHFLNSRGFGLEFRSGNWTVFSAAYETQINNMSGKKSDSTLYGLNFVRFKGSGDPFSSGSATAVDFDDAVGFISYKSDRSTWFYGKSSLKLGSSSRNNLFINSTSGTFPYFKFTWQNSLLTYQFGYAFLKHYSGRQKLTDKSLIFHHLSLNLFDNWSFYGYEGITQVSHSPKIEYLNPFILLRSADHYNYSPDNAMLGIGVNYSTTDLKLYTEILIDDMESSKLGTGWFRNKIAGLLGVDVKSTVFDREIKSSVDVVWVTPHTFSHRNPVLNMTHYGTPVGPELGPNSMKIGFYNAAPIPEFSIKLELNYEFLMKGLSTAAINYGDDINIGHPDIYSSGTVINPSLKFENYPQLLSGNRVYTHYFNFSAIYQWFGIDFYGSTAYYTNTFKIPYISIDRGLYLSAGMKYRFDLFDNKRLEFW